MAYVDSNSYTLGKDDFTWILDLPPPTPPEESSELESSDGGPSRSITNDYLTGAEQSSVLGSADGGASRAASHILLSDADADGDMDMGEDDNDDHIPSGSISPGSSRSIACELVEDDGSVHGSVAEELPIPDSSNRAFLGQNVDIEEHKLCKAAFRDAICRRLVFECRATGSTLPTLPYHLHRGLNLYLGPKIMRSSARSWWFRDHKTWTTGIAGTRLIRWFFQQKHARWYKEVLEWIFKGPAMAKLLELHKTEWATKKDARLVAWLHKADTPIVLKQINRQIVPIVRAADDFELTFALPKDNTVSEGTLHQVNQDAANHQKRATVILKDPAHPRPRFMKTLPLELREMIYGYVIEPRTIEIIFMTNEEAEAYAQSIRNRRIADDKARNPQPDIMVIDMDLTDTDYCQEKKQSAPQNFRFINTSTNKLVLHAINRETRHYALRRYTHIFKTQSNPTGLLFNFNLDFLACTMQYHRFINVRKWQFLGRKSFQEDIARIQNVAYLFISHFKELDRVKKGTPNARTFVTSFKALKQFIVTLHLEHVGICKHCNESGGASQANGDIQAAICFQSAKSDFEDLKQKMINEGKEWVAPELIYKTHCWRQRWNLALDDVKEKA
ncbi:hypothetical protein VTL71DRAFT_15117 [Oculimacula yallundae]|uniref:2EXR domain-containing protein n=1 Tax=Oculimacula yallundae TaxID=86028 RepID=A0ABR4CHY4_9HELO